MLLFSGAVRRAFFVAEFARRAAVPPGVSGVALPRDSRSVARPWTVFKACAESR